MVDIATEMLSDWEQKRLAKYFTNIRENGIRYIRTKPGNCVLPTQYEECKEQFLNWKIRPDDTYVITYIKNGTTWTQELVWCLQNNVDLETAKSVQLFQRTPFLDFQFMGAMNKIYETNYGSVLEKAEKMESPRVLKTHLPFCLLPVDLLNQSKVVVCLRNPKDTAVSFYHHVTLLKSHGFSGDFKAFFDLFMDGLVMYGSYWDFVLNAWKLKDHPNVCLLFYEDMKKDLASNVRKVASFLKKDLTDTQIQSLVEHLSFKNMKENAAVNLENLRQSAFTDASGPGSFIRKGEVGDWKNYFTEEMNNCMDAAIEKYFKGTGLEFSYE